MHTRHVSCHILGSLRLGVDTPNGKTQESLLSRRQGQWQDTFVVIYEIKTGLLSPPDVRKAPHMAQGLFMRSDHCVTLSSP